LKHFYLKSVLYILTFMFCDFSHGQPSQNFSFLSANHNFRDIWDMGRRKNKHHRENQNVQSQVPGMASNSPETTQFFR